MAIPDIVSKCQRPSISDRSTTNNMLLAHQLMKHYDRKSITCSDMIMIDNRKAYDTIDWTFLRFV